MVDKSDTGALKLKLEPEKVNVIEDNPVLIREMLL
jgi:hypothetical protein